METFKILTRFYVPVSGDTGTHATLVICSRGDTGTHATAEICSSPVCIVL